MAVGTAVVLFDVLAIGPMVTIRDFDRLRPFNFGRRTLQDPLTVDGVVRQIARYDASDAALVSARIRADAGMEPAVDALESLYREAIAGFRNHARDRDAEDRAASRYLRWLSPRLKNRA
jgi:hypothetical protein